MNNAIENAKVAKTKQIVVYNVRKTELYLSVIAILGTLMIQKYADLATIDAKHALILL